MKDPMTELLEKFQDVRIDEQNEGGHENKLDPSDTVLRPDFGWLSPSDEDWYHIQGRTMTKGCFLKVKGRCGFSGLATNRKQNMEISHYDRETSTVTLPSSSTVCTTKEPDPAQRRLPNIQRVRRWLLLYVPGPEKKKKNVLGYLSPVEFDQNCFGRSSTQTPYRLLTPLQAPTH